jgi:hypothetical protein
MSDDHRDQDRYGLPDELFTRWYGFGSPVGLAVLLVGLGAFFALLGEGIAIPLGLFR